MGPASLSEKDGTILARRTVTATRQHSAAAPEPTGDDDGFAGVAVQRFTVAPGNDGERLDKMLAAVLGGVSRSRVQQWIADGRVRVNATARRARDAVATGDVVEVEATPSPEDAAYAPEPMPLAIVYEDAELLVLDKPAGRVVHPAAGNWSGTLLNGLLAYDPSLAQLPRAGIVHRLDADTSGLMVVARTLRAHADLVRQLQERSVTREYWALVFGTAPPAGTIDAALARDPRHPLRFTTSRATTARLARTHYRAIASVDLQPLYVGWLACRLDTGRTHQIRVHLESVGHPLIGDPVYRRGRPALLPEHPLHARLATFSRQALHACALRLRHPVSGRTLGWFRAPPADLRDLMKALGFKGMSRAVKVFE
jgi:23S rRNA pseudouridine1911/1915/1917 synthase